MIILLSLFRMLQSPELRSLFMSSKLSHLWLCCVTCGVSRPSLLTTNPGPFIRKAALLKTGVVTWSEQHDYTLRVILGPFSLRWSVNLCTVQHISALEHK